MEKKALREFIITFRISSVRELFMKPSIIPIYRRVVITISSTSVYFYYHHTHPVQKQQCNYFLRLILTPYGRRRISVLRTQDRIVIGLYAHTTVELDPRVIRYFL